VSRTTTPPLVSRTTTPLSLSRTLTAPIAIDTTDLRTPGSEFVLPANPLMNLSDESLEGFVDCTIYEETGNFFEDGSLATDVAALATPRMRTASMIALAEPLAMPSVTPTPDPAPTTSGQFPAYTPFSTMSSIQPFTPPPPRTSTSEIPAYSRTATGEIPRTLTSEMPALSRTTTGEIASARTATGNMPAYATGDVPAYPQASPTDLSYPRLSAPYPQVFPQAPPGNVAPWTAPRRDHASRALDKRRMIVIGGVAAIGILVIVLIVAIASGGSTDTADAQTPAPAITTPHATKTDSPVVSHTDSPPTPRTDPTPSPEHATEDDPPPPAPHGLPVVGSGPCKLTVTTTPAGSIIQVDGNAAGPSPLTIASACQRTRIDVAHPRYQSQSRFVALAADHPGTLDVTLSRPTHAVTVLTLPPGAEVLIDGRRAGTTPTIVQVLGYTSVDLTIEKAGYKSLTKRVYSKVPQDRMFVKLDKK